MKAVVENWAIIVSIVVTVAVIAEKITISVVTINAMSWRPEFV